MTTHSKPAPSLLWFAVPAALSVRWTYLILSGRAIDAADSIHYIAMAQQFAAGDFWSFDENLPVLYSALAAVAHLVIPDWEAAFRAVSLIVSSLTVVPVCFLSRELHGLRAARIMAVLVVFWPWLVDYASRIQPEALAVCLWFTSLWLVYRAITAGRAYLVLAPLALFALHLARPEGTLIMIAAPAGAFLVAWQKGPPRMRRVVVLAAAVVVLAGAYMAVMRAVIGTATLSYRAPMPTDWVEYFSRGAVALGETFFKITFNALPLMLGPFLLAFIGLGLFAPPEHRRDCRLEALIAVFCAVQYLATLANFSPSPRYLMPVVLAGGLWAAWGIDRARAILEQHGKAPLARLPVALVVATFLLSFVASLAADRLGTLPESPIEYRAAGEWMKEHLEPGLILSRKPQVGFYAGMPTTGPDAGDDVPALVDRAKETGARYVVVDQRYTAGLVPGIAGLLDAAAAPDELELVHEVRAWEGAAVVIYEVRIPGMRYLTPGEFPRPDSHMGPDQRRRTTPRAPSE